MKTCIIVLGMHRSGTSTVAGALSAAGLSLGNNLLGAEVFNPKGLYEDKFLNKSNSDYIKSFHSDWNEFFTSTSQDADRSEQFSQKIASYLAGFEADVFAIKDPRICLLIPEYQRACELAKINPVYIIVERDHLDIARSLQKRDNMPLFYGYWLSVFYRKRVQLSESDLTVIQKITYLDFIRNPVSFIEEVYFKLTIMKPVDVKTVSGFVTAELNNNSKSDYTVWDRFLKWIFGWSYYLIVPFRFIRIEKLFTLGSKKY